MTDADWLAAVAAAPDDPLVRLVYADWLDDHNDPRGEQLRLDVTLAGLADDDPVSGPLRKRLAELVPGTDARWRAAVCQVPVETDEQPFINPRRHPLNVASPWYTCGDCMSCGAPEVEAPELLALLHEGNLTTHSVRQPRTLGEVRRACRAAEVCCVADLRYGGTDPVVIRMLGNDPAYCDHLLCRQSPTVEPAPPPSTLVNAPAMPVPVPADGSGRLSWWIVLLGVSTAVKIVMGLVRWS